MAEELVLRRVEDFGSLYANNVRFEPSAWDLKIIFGELDQGAGTDQGASAVELHTAITVPWPVAKLVAYYVTANCVVHQADAGQIVVRRNVVPPRPDVSDEAWSKVDPKLVAYLAWVHDQFFGENPYVPPSVAAAHEGGTEEGPSGTADPHK